MLGMKYCSKCGNKLILKESFNCGISDGMVPFCPKCEEFRFPMFNTAVSNVIYNKDFSKTLLVQQYGRGINILVAGYVNKGETLENALIREIKEETGLCVHAFQFNASRYFEKSNSLICNFIVTVEDENLRCNSEIDFAKWYTINEARNAVYKNSLAEEFFLKSLEKISSPVK